MSTIPPDFLLSSYAFELPKAQIAQYPARNRSASRLMLFDRQSGHTRIGSFTDILTYLPDNCLIVANNSRVAPARVFGSRSNGGKIEVLLLTPVPLLEQNCREALPGWKSAEAEALLRPAKKIAPGERMNLSNDLIVSVRHKGEFGRCRVHMAWQGNLLSVLERCGQLPLPPYIRRAIPSSVSGTWSGDSERYQTVYADMDKTGSVAAPTAGLHFTPELRKQLLRSGREWVEVTLYVGYGTFSPVRSQDIRKHALHAEYVELPPTTAAAIVQAKREKRPVIAVGTTSTRTLEGIFAAQHPEPCGGSAFSGLAAHTGWINTFLYPGKPFNIIDGLITNFHLPESSLLMLVAALAGRERILAAYREAIAQGFRFFSYGDAMLVL